MAMDVHFQVRHPKTFPFVLGATIYIYRNLTIFSQKKKTKLDWNMEGYYGKKP